MHLGFNDQAHLDLALQRKPMGFSVLKLKNTPNLTSFNVFIRLRETITEKSPWDYINELFGEYIKSSAPQPSYEHYEGQGVWLIRAVFDNGYNIVGALIEATF